MEFLSKIEFFTKAKTCYYDQLAKYQISAKIEMPLIDQFIISNLTFNVSQIRLVELEDTFSGLKRF